MALHPCLGSMWWEFDSPLADHFECVPVAQTDSAFGCEPKGREFDSLRAHQIFSLASKIMLAKRRKMKYSLIR